MPGPRISVFPKCWFDDFVRGERDYVQWIRDAARLGGEGVEHYDGFMHGDAEIAAAARACEETAHPTSRIPTRRSGRVRSSGRRRQSS